MKLQNKLNLFNIARIENHPLILDGAMGSLLQQSGVESKGKLWTALANIENSQLVKEIHSGYILAGADIITANTFRTNPEALKGNEHGYSSAQIVRKSLSLAIQAGNHNDILIAGSNAPAEDCYQRTREISQEALSYNHERHIDLLMENGADFILNETHSHMDEIEIICKYCLLNKIPYVISLFFTNDLKILSGEKVKEAVAFIRQHNPLAIGFNCIFPETFKKLSEVITLDFNFGFYFNCGSGEVTDEVISCGIDPESYWMNVKEFLYLKPSFIGACCGSNANHIKFIREQLNGIPGN